MPRGKVNNRARGRRKEMKVRDILIAQGYDVQMAPMPTRWQRSTDMFGGVTKKGEKRLGLWDMVAVGPYDIRFIQVKTEQSATNGQSIPWKKKAKAWPCPPEARKELWILADRKEPRIIKL
jgi:hypothetical protein